MTPVTTSTEASSRLFEDFLRVRRQSEELCRPLTPEDMMVQSCAEASPAKWHLAHTTWFFETFLLQEFLPGYREFHPDFRWLFNSYYNSVSDQPEKKLRASFSRPPVETILSYRRHVEEGIQRLLASNPQEEAARILLPDDAFLGGARIDQGGSRVEAIVTPEGEGSGAVLYEPSGVSGNAETGVDERVSGPVNGEGVGA